MTQLETKVIEATPVVSITVKATLKTIMDDIGDIPDKIMGECQEQNIEICGPFIFEYRGTDGNLDTPFDLEMALPVKEGITYKGKHQYKSLPSFQCVQQRYVGPVSDIEKNGYVPLMQTMQEQSLPIKDSCREVYTNWVGPDSGENIIELQMAV